MRAALATLLIVVGTASGSRAQTFTTLASFDESDGAKPLYMSLIQGTDGNFYGTTLDGGDHNDGTVFQLTRGGALTVLHSFDSSDPFPYSGLDLASDGNFYATTYSGGTAGTTFKLSPAGILTTLHNFDIGDGASPLAGLVQGIDGNFYGTTQNGGAYSDGTIFRMTPTGSITTLHSFSGADGAFPYATLTQGIDGNFYGTTLIGGVNDQGTVFKISRRGTFTTLYSFVGGYPSGAMVQGIDELFYGTTQNGGTHASGTIFRMSEQGDLVTLYSFCSLPDCADGDTPFGGLIEATDLNFYGMTSGLRSQAGGTVFKITARGELITLHTFDGDDGYQPYGGLLQGTDGKFYGATQYGGAFDYGTLFSLAVGPGPFVAFVRPAGKVGQKGGILGQGFTGTTAVSLNGTPVSFTVVADTFIRATVPAGATTGYITVTTPTGTLTSNKPFVVIP